MTILRPLALSALLLLPAGFARAQDAAASHPPPSAEGAAESADARKVTDQILCMCGTCVNETLHACTCGTAAQEREKVAAAIAAGNTPDQLIQAYVERYGPEILAVPPRTGLNLIGWLVPFIAAGLGIVFLTWILRGWRKNSMLSPAAAAAAAVAGGDAVPADPEERRYRERVEKDLKEFEG
jgi:cytochrome c-type biogenesis protein CcmH